MCGSISDNMKTYIILGSCYGDEAKGATTDLLSRQNPDALVVRFNGGHQAGHTVVVDGKRHIFASFGSGSLRGNESYFSQHCTVHPRALLNELNGLRKIGCNPKLTIDSLSMITTPYDIAWNRYLESLNGHGSCGVGFGATIERNLSLAKLYAKDFISKDNFQEKMFLVADYYVEKFKSFQNLVHSEYHPLNVQMYDFIEAVYEMLEFVHIETEESVFRKHKNVIFEGAQGILLDMDHGYFPHVTRSSTTSKNALEIIKRNNLSTPEIYYATRCYQSRHGNGPMTNEQYSHLLKLSNNENETNILNKWQGNFRTSPFDFNSFAKALQIDAKYSNGCRKSVVTSCMDQVEDLFPTTINEEITMMSRVNFVDKIKSMEEWDAIIVGDSPSTDDWNVQ